GAASTEEAGELGEILCGASRPGHFAGVLTAVGRLFALRQPEVAVFGEKDWQQLVLVRRLAAARGGPEILPVPTVRDETGLALSSRNRHLDKGQREQALALPRALAEMTRLWHAGCREAAWLERQGRLSMGSAAAALIYLEARPPALVPRRQRLGAEAVMLGAHRVGGVRLIDNTPLLTCG
ncbi:pantoate--beta-alanine ligase, partial [bacterium]|nr:pantoate--beta-alanine ligase [bacterium]